MQHDREMIPAMEFSEEGKEVWQRVVAASTDPYAQRIISYAEDWVRLMQADMLRGRQLEDVADEGNLIVTIIAEDTTFSDDSTSHNYGPAVDVYVPPTIIECPEDKVPGWLDESGTPQGCVDNSPVVDPLLPGELTPPVVVQKPVGGVAVVSTKEPVVASSSVSVVEGSLPRTGAEGLLPAVLFGLLFGGALLRLRRAVR